MHKNKCYTCSQQTHNKLNFAPLKPFVYKSFV